MVFINSAINKMPAGEIKKLLLSKKLDFDLLDEDTVLRLLDYEITFFVDHIGETKFYKMCLKALSRFINFEVTEENAREIAESPYSLCYSKRQQRKWRKMLRQRNEGAYRRRERKTKRLRMIRRLSVFTLAMFCLFIGRNIAVSGYNPFSTRLAGIHELFDAPQVSVLKKGADGIHFTGEIKKYSSFEELCKDLNISILFPDSVDSDFKASSIWYVDDLGNNYVRIKWDGIDMYVYLEYPPFDKESLPLKTENIGGKEYYTLQNKGHSIQMILFSDEMTYSFVSSDEALLKNFLFHLK